MGQGENRADWESLRVFYHVAKCQNITATAEKLRISQPAVSHTIKLLEEGLGCKLFTRLPKGVALTQEGRLLFSHVSAAYQEITQGERGVQELLHLETGEIRIAVSATALRFYLLDHINSFRERYPKVGINILNVTSPQAVEAVDKNKADLGFVATPITPHPGLTCRHIREIRDIFIASADSPLAKRSSCHLAELADEELITLPYGSCSRIHYDAYFAAYGLTLAPKHLLSSHDLVLEFTERGLGVGIITEDFALQSLQAGRVRRLEVIEPIPPREIQVVTNERQQSFLAQRFLECLE